MFSIDILRIKPTYKNINDHNNIKYLNYNKNCLLLNDINN